MASLIYASRADDCCFEIALVTGDRPDAPGLALAEAEGIYVHMLDAKALGSSFWTKLNDALEEAGVYDNDGQIDRLIVRRGAKRNPAGVTVTMAALPAGSVPLDARRVLH